MIIDRMHLTNYKRFRDEEIIFPNGLTGITGNNGVGKSSIVDAIFFALFGVADKSMASDFIVSSFADGEKCQVTLDFTVGSEFYRLQRTFKKGKTVQHDAVLLCGTEERATGVSQVEAEVRHILGMGPADFRNTVYAAQKDLLTLLDLTPGKRKEWFLRALGLDYLNKGSQEILKAEVDAKEKEATLLQGEITALSRQDPTEIGQVRASLVELGTHITTLQAAEIVQQQNRDKLAEDLKQFTTKAAERSQLAEKHNELLFELSDLAKRSRALAVLLDDSQVSEQEIADLEKTVAGIPQAREDIETYRKKKNDIDRIAVEQKAWVKIETDHMERRTKLTAQLADLDKKEAELKGLAAKVCTALGYETDAQVDDAVSGYNAYATEKIANLQAQIRALDEGSKAISAKLKTLREIGPEGTCPICLQHLGEHFETVEKEYLSQINDATAESHDLNAKLDDALHDSHKVPDLKPTLDRIREIRIALGYRELLQQQLTEANGKSSEASGKVVALIKEYDAVAYNEEDHLACRQRMAELEAAQGHLQDLTRKSKEQAGTRAQLAEISVQVATKTAALDKVKAAIDMVPLDLAVGARLEHEIQKLDITLKSLREDLAASKERERSTAVKVKELEAAAAQIGILQQQLAALKDETEILKLTRSAIAEYVVYLMQVVRARLETEVSSIIAEITGGRYDQVLIDPDFNLLVRENDREYTVDRFSGGEQDDIAVALRIALSRYLAELHNVHESTLLIFDEIFGSQDEERRANLLTALRSQESRFPQILLISHIAEIQGEFENTLIVQGNGPTSTVQAGV
jgi:exonuclease SbcC